MRRIINIILFILPLTCNSQELNTDDFFTRRNKVLSMLDSSSALVLKAINSTPLANEYIQEYNFYYLTGITTPLNALLMSPGGIKVGSKTKNAVFFFTSSEDIRDIKMSSGDTALKIYEFKKVFNSLLPSLKKLYFSAPDLIVINDWLNDKVYFIDRDMKNGLKTRYPKLKIESAEYFVGRLRAIKSPYETDCIRKASNITADGLINAMMITHPDIYEYELQAAVEYEFTRQGAMLRGFPSIIGSGPNNLILHYSKNTRQAKAGELIVMDVGAKYLGYSSDITRTIPVSGIFSDAEKEIYSIVLTVQKEIISQIKPGLSIETMEKSAIDAFKKFGYEKYYTHGLSHSVGLDVHDISLETILTPGMVITIEPGLYFPENDKNISEKFRGFGVRIEDIILITNDGYEILSQKVPKEIAEIENLMKHSR